MDTHFSAAQPRGADTSPLASFYRKRQVAGGDHAEYRQPASKFRDFRGTRDRAGMATIAMLYALDCAKRFELSWVRQQFT